MKLILATSNNDKIREIRELLSDLSITIVTHQNLDGFPEVIEDRNSLKGNATKKAKTVWSKYKLPVVADDTGLFVNL